MERIIESEIRKTSQSNSNSIYLGETILREIITPQTPRILIPRCYLFGTQTASEYSVNKRRRIEKALSEQGFNFLIQNPALVCADLNPKGVNLFIVDGHHRARYSGRYNIHDIPCVVLSANQLLFAINTQRSRSEENTISETDLLRRLRTDASEATTSFKSLPDFKQPRGICRISSVRELKSMFAISSVVPEYSPDMPKEEALKILASGKWGFFQDWANA